MAVIFSTQPQERPASRLVGRGSVTATPTFRSKLVCGGCGGSNVVCGEYEEPGILLGEGSFGSVRKMRHRASGEWRAVKTVQKLQEMDQAMEAKLLTNLDHPHILRLFACSEDACAIFMVMELCEGGEILDAVREARLKGSMMPEEWAAVGFRQVFSAIAYCHGKGVVHKDLKGGNILLLRRPEKWEQLFEMPPHAVVADLGLAEVFGQNRWSLLQKRCHEKEGTASTMAPEVWGGSYGPKCDVWSLGCVLYELLTAKRPFQRKQKDLDAKRWRLILERGPDWSPMKRLSAEANDFSRKLLTFREGSRPSSNRCLEHSWIKLFGQGHRASTVEIRRACEAVGKWRDVTPTQRAFCLKLATERTAVQRFAAVFSQFDKDANGTLSQVELTNALRQLGVDEVTAKATAASIDINGDNVCEFVEFAAACISALEDEFIEYLWQDFQALDVTGKGRVTKRGLEKFVEQLRPFAPSRNCQLLDLSTVGDGLVSFEEFSRFFGRRAVDEAGIAERVRLRCSDMSEHQSEATDATDTAATGRVPFGAKAAAARAARAAKRQLENAQTKAEKENEDDDSDSGSWFSSDEETQEPADLELQGTSAGATGSWPVARLREANRKDTHLSTKAKAPAIVPKSFGPCGALHSPRQEPGHTPRRHKQPSFVPGVPVCKAKMPMASAVSSEGSQQAIDETRPAAKSAAKPTARPAKAAPCTLLEARMPSKKSQASSRRPSDASVTSTRVGRRPSDASVTSSKAVQRPSDASVAISKVCTPRTAASSKESVRSPPAVRSADPVAQDGCISRESTADHNSSPRVPPSMPMPLTHMTPTLTEEILDAKVAVVPFHEAVCSGFSSERVRERVIVSL